MPDIRRKLELFEMISSDLAEQRPELKDAVLCPLCLRQFAKEDLESLNGNEPRLSVEHIIPSAVRGVGLTLTCRRCNNEQGSALDGQVVQMLRSQAVLDGDVSVPPLRGHITVGEVKLPMHFSWGVSETGERYGSMTVPGASPKDLELYETTMRSLGGHPKPANDGHLKTGQ